MACLFGARLAPHVDVTLLGTWPDGLAAIRRFGIRLEAGGLETRHPVGVTSNPLEVQGARFVLVLVKSWQTRRTATMLSNCLATDGVALTLQNGLGNREILESQLGVERATLGVTTMGATLVAPGLVRVGGSGPTYLGRHPSLDPYVGLLRHAGFEVEIEQELDSLLWGKLVVNTAINPLTALLRVPNGALLESEPTRDLMTDDGPGDRRGGPGFGDSPALPRSGQAGDRGRPPDGGQPLLDAARCLARRPDRGRLDQRRGRPPRGAAGGAGASQSNPVAVGSCRRPQTERWADVIVCEALDEMRRARAARGNPLGLVPTMGYLHAGHLSLVRMARQDCPSVAVSIFVNPTQFGPHEDLAAYPRDLPRDLELLASEGVHLVWTPSASTMYPPGFQTYVEVEGVSRGLEGAHRQGHFRGVATVVAKLFHAFEPQRAYFGQKDAQQVAVIRRMTADLDFPIEIQVGPTVRDPDGLALSSRNAYLSPDERRAAPVLYRALTAGRLAFEAGERQADGLRRAMKQVLDAEPLARIQYVSAAHPETLEELNGQADRALLSMAVVVGKTRLIDNLGVGDPG